jgi:two-component system, NtrC family, sensor kinase
MRTLSARILLGFAALTVTFGVITTLIVMNMQVIEEQVTVTNRGYVQLALESKDLKSRQNDLKNYLKTGDTEKETKDPKEPGRISNQALRRYRTVRDIALDNARKVLEKIQTIIENDRQQFTVSGPKLKRIKELVDEVKPLYDQVFESRDATDAERARDLAHQLVQYLEGNEELDDWLAIANAPGDPARLEALGKLRVAEAKIAGETENLSAQLERSVENTTDKLESNTHVVRVRTIYLGLLVVGLGLMITVWITLTLRPLRRLRDGARRVAAGDYASRIPERGPSEIAELAREFNSMGRAVEEREKERVRAEQLAAVAKMARVITHEVRNPLSAIALNVELLEDHVDPNNQEARDVCKAIHHEIDRLTEITEEYLRFARMPKPKLAPEAVNTLVGALAAFVREDLAARHIELRVDLASGDPIASIDAGQIRQCLINLVRNAADAIEDRPLQTGGVVTLRTRVPARPNPSHLEIEVEDNGVGISPDVQTKLFDAFFSTKKGGNGLGLALTQQIIRDHGGDLRLASAVGRGTTITVIVPMGG